MIGQLLEVASQRRSVSSSGSSTAVAAPMSTCSLPSIRKTRLQTTAPGLLTPLMVPPPRAKYMGGWRSLTVPA